MDPIDAISMLIPPSDLLYVIPGLFAASGLCNVLAFFVAPPKPGAKLYKLKKGFYLAVTWGAANLGKAANRIQCGYTGLMVPYDKRSEAAEILTKNGIELKTKLNKLN